MTDEIQLMLSGKLAWPRISAGKQAGLIINGQDQAGAGPNN